MAVLILIFSTGLFFFYFQVVCQKILRRQFVHKLSHAIVTANGFEFPSLRKALNGIGAPVEYPNIVMALRCDFRALTYLAKNTANVRQRYSYEERILIIYFKLALVSLVTCHWLRLREKPIVLSLTAILEYFANAVSERMHAACFSSMTPSDYLLNL
jgi:hypothetical protein